MKTILEDSIVLTKSTNNRHRLDIAGGWTESGKPVIIVRASTVLDKHRTAIEEFHLAPSDACEIANKILDVIPRLYE